MEVYIFWGGLGLLLISLLIGFLTGIIRGVKRSALHILFLVVSIVASFFLTGVVTKALLGISIGAVDGVPTTIEGLLLSYISKAFPVSEFSSLDEFSKKLPTAVASPIVFLILSILVYFVFDILYLIISRIALGKKKKDFAKHKPYRAFGGVIGMIEGLLFIFILFAPITSLTKTYEKLATSSTQSEVQTNQKGLSDTITSGRRKFG